MERIYEITKRVEKHVLDIDLPWVGTMWRPFTSAEIAAEGERGSRMGGVLTHVWADGVVGGAHRFATEAEARVWEAERLECWVEEVEPDGFGARQFRTMVRPPDAIFPLLTDGEVNLLAAVLDDALARDGEDDLFRSQVNRLLKYAARENTARAERAKRLHFEHGVKV